MPRTSAGLRLAASISLFALIGTGSAGCAASSEGRPAVLIRPAVAVHASQSPAEISAANGPNQLRVVSQLVRTFIRRINHKHAAHFGRLYIFKLVPHIDTPTAADVYLALERGIGPRTPLIFREVQLRLENGRWVITASLPT
jgi:hypothetical protein